MKKIRVVIADDSALIRGVLKDMLLQFPEVELVGVARNGAEAVELARTLKPDVMTLDVEMPQLDGLGALKQIMSDCPTRVIMLSSLTSEGSETTLEALHSGAIDFLCKPANGAPSAIRLTRDELHAKIITAATARLHVAPKRFAAREHAPANFRDHVVLVASSTGGPKALTTFFETLPKGFNVPIVIVQHMPASFTPGLAARLARTGPVDCREAAPGDKPTPGLALVAPGGKHLVFNKSGVVQLSDEPPLHGVKPAADLMMISAVEAFGRKCVGVVLTGMGRDGAKGAVSIRQAGGVVFGESEETCTVYGMPKAAMSAGGVNVELPIGSISYAVSEFLAGHGLPKESRLAS